MRLSLDQAVRAMNAVHVGRASGMELKGAAIDSRKVCPGDLFFCLPGTRVDGHDFAAQALQNGAAAIVAARSLPNIKDQVPILLVEDTIRALGALGRAWRAQATARVIGVTGSAGKTTVKEMLARVCSLAGETCKNHLNLNNQIGLPLSLLSCTGRERFWVMEAGISRPGDMDDLGQILAPDFALVINVGAAHLEALGSVQGVARAKASLLKYLQKGGTALVNQDNPDLWQASKAALPSVHGFSTRDANAEFYGCRHLDEDSRQVRMELFLRGRPLELSWPLPSAPLLENVLAVAGTASLLGVDDHVISQGLSSTQMTQGRFQIRQHGGWLFIDDTYNANPLSMHMALERARELAGPRPLVCVLGDMLELGGEAVRAHRELGKSLALEGCAAVLFHGRHAQDVLAGLSGTGWTGCFTALESPRGLLDAWKGLEETHGVVLFKGSRAGAMETFLNALCPETTT